jgi:hypothetical protein
MSSSTDAFAPRPDSAPECRKCSSSAVTLTGVLPQRPNRAEVRAFRCTECNGISMFVVDNGSFREW